MAINLASKYSDKIAKVFALKSVVDGTTNRDYSFTGVRSINIYTPITQPLNNYSRTGANRYGEPTEMQDTLQEMILSRDRAFSITIDKGNSSEQMDVKAAGKMLALEMDEQVIPEIDQYALGRYIDYAGTVKPLTSALTEKTIVKALSDGLVEMSNRRVPKENRHIFLTWSNFGLLRLAPEFIGAEGLATKSLVRGALGTFMGAQVIPVPDEYLKKGGSQAQFLITHRSAAMQPKKIQDYFVKQNPPGINGALLEGRFIYDAFVIGAKSAGVYAAVAAGAQQTAPANSYTAASKSMAVSSTGASRLAYTVDGTDPRYSKTARESSGGSATVDMTEFAGRTVTFKSVAFSGSAFTSDVTTTTQAV